MEPQLFDLDVIRHNPWQPREKDDPGHVLKIAESIVQQGMMQIPVGRLVDPDGKPASCEAKDLKQLLATGWRRVQLAFGHTRLAAYRLIDQVQCKLENKEAIEFEDDSPMARLVVIADQRLEVAVRFNRMPVIIRELTDEEMFALGVQENIARKDLSAIEEARAMLRYREEFKKTSAEIGKLFGLNESTVRNKMRLVTELPEEVQPFVADGKISEFTARKLASVEKALPGTSKSIATSLAASGITSTERVNDSIERTLRDKGGKCMYSAYYSSNRELSAGPGLWPLDWTPDDIRDLKYVTFEKLYSGPQEATILYPSISNAGDHPTKYTIQSAFQNLCLAARAKIRSQKADTVSTRLAEKFPDALNLIIQLIRPPACTICPFYLRLDGSHWCMFETCWKNKKSAWLEQEVARLSSELGIPVYDREKDGPCEELTSRWTGNEHAEEWFKSRVDHLRLKPSYSEYSTYWLTDSHAAMLVSVCKEFQEKKQEEKEHERQAKQNQNYEQLCREAAYKFLCEQVYPAIMAQAFDGIRDARVCVLMTDSWKFRDFDFGNPTDPATIDRAVMKILDDHVPYHLRVSKGPVFIAKELQEKLPQWGIKISGDLVQVAKSYDPANTKESA